MRRVLTILTAIALLVVSLGIGVFTADLPFWRRALQLPLEPGAIYLPAATITGLENAGEVEGDAAAIPTSVEPEAAGDGAADHDHSFAAAMAAAAERAGALGARALLVLRDGHLVTERYFLADDADTLLPAGVISRAVAAMSVGIALAEGRVSSLDAPVATWLREWDGDARGAITLRQLLEDTSGLETGGDVARLLRRSPFADLASLPRFATSRGVRMWLGNDFESSALGFRLAHESGGFHGASPANTQLAAVIIERATGEPYERYVERKLWRPLGAGLAEMQLDRRAGMPAAHCCWRATARDMLRVAALLATDGQHDGRAVLPPGWVTEMTRPSRVSADTGLQVNLARVGEQPAYESVEEGSAFWVLPSSRLVVLVVGASPVANATLREIPALVAQALAGGPAGSSR